LEVGYHAITSGVSWTLWYEWLLYCSLPIIAFLGLCKPSKLWLVSSFVVVTFLAITHLFNPGLLLNFLIGSACSFFVSRGKSILLNISGKLKSIILLAIIISLYSSDPTDFAIQLILTGLLFYLLSIGFDVFGVFRSKASNVLSELGYSIYLVQGPFIYIAIYIFGFEEYAKLSTLELMFFVLIVTPVYVLICLFTYIYIEKIFYNKKILLIVKNYFLKYKFY
jgi:peptidoglycan/LPS O-acetylase OafA/YrhL